jgi:acyl-CoA synthetase (NDP forming)
MTGTKSPARDDFRDLATLLNPASIAVVGASDARGNLGGTAIGFLRRFGYPGEVIPVNPRHATVGGLTCYPAISDSPVVPELAILAVRAAQAPDLIHSAAASGVRHGIIWAGGFAEVGGDGVALQRQVTDICRETGFSLVGPNCIGFINSLQPAVASFASFLATSGQLLPGNIAMVSQSGGLGTQAQAFAQRAGFGFRYMVSTGNEADLTVADFISAFSGDEHSQVIAVYLEGIRDGERLITALGQAREAGKAVVILKGGAAPASARAAAAHTGALAGEDRVMRAVFAELGVIQVDSLEELLDASLFLSSTDPAKLPRGDRLAVVTFGGGGGVLAADQAARSGLSTPPLSDTTRERLAPLLPPIASLANPVDVTPQTFNQPEYLARFTDALMTVADDQGIDAVLVLFGPMSRGTDEVIDSLARLRTQTTKTVGLAWPSCPESVRARLEGERFCVFEEPARAIAALGHAARFRRRQPESPGSGPARPAARPGIASTGFDWAGFDWDRFTGPVSPGLVLSEQSCHELLSAAGLPVAPGALARSADGVAAAFAAAGPPAVLKAISPVVTHRHDAGLVRLDVRSPAEAQEAYAGLAGRAAQLGVPLEGIYVQHLVHGGTEVLVSAFRDPMFGVIVSCAAGGTLTEVIDDVALARAPLDQDQALRLLRGVRLVRRTERKAGPAGLADLGRFVAAFSQLAAAAPWARFVLEVNPVKWCPESPIAVDGLLVVEQP